MSPLRSKAQQRYLFAKHPEIAKEFADATPNIKALPEHVKSKTKVEKMKHEKQKEHKKHVKKK